MGRMVNNLTSRTLPLFPILSLWQRQNAMKIVLQHFSGYIASLSMRKLCDERGNVYFGVDEDIRQRLQARLMRAILTFRVE